MPCAPNTVLNHSVQSHGLIPLRRRLHSPFTATKMSIQRHDYLRTVQLQLYWLVTPGCLRPVYFVPGCTHIARLSVHAAVHKLK